MREIDYCKDCGQIWDPLGFWENLAKDQGEELTMEVWSVLVNTQYCTCEAGKEREKKYLVARSQAIMNIKNE